MVLESGRITEEGLERLRSRVGSFNRPRQYGVGLFNEDASRSAIRHFCQGIGDTGDHLDYSIMLGAPVAGLDFGDHVPKLEVVYWFSILMAVNLQTSFLTPPFGFALFYMKGVAPPEVRIQQIYRGIIPFVILQLIGLGLVIAFPEIAMWLPRVMLE